MILGELAGAVIILEIVGHVTEAGVRTGLVYAMVIAEQGILQTFVYILAGLIAQEVVTWGTGAGWTLRGGLTTVVALHRCLASMTGYAAEDTIFVGPVTTIVYRVAGRVQMDASTITAMEVTRAQGAVLWRVNVTIEFI